MPKGEIKFKTIVLSILALIFVTLVFLSVAIYGLDWKNSWINKLEKVVPFPAAVVGQRKIISLADFSQNSQSVRQFYENQDFSKIGLRVDFNTSDGQKRLKIREKEVLGKMIEDQAILILAQKEGIIVTSKDLEDNVDKKLEEYGNRESVKGELQRLYGWTIEDFKEKIVAPALYREKLAKVYEEKYQNNEASQKKIEEAKNLITKSQKSFSEVVSQFSEGSTAETGGELGWFKKDQIIPEIADKIFSLKKGEMSPVLESPLGFHIVEMEERKNEGETELVRIRQIFSAKKTFPDWVGEQLKTMKIWILLKGYTWNADKLQAEFINQGMKDFEEQVRKDPQGDASVIF